MNLSTRPLSKCYELTPYQKDSNLIGVIIFNRRVILGRSESCDLVIKKSSVSGIHAVIEISEEGGRVYDMNSESGTRVNGEKIICKDIKVGDKISFGNQEFVFKEYQKSNSLPPVLGSSGSVSDEKGPTEFPTPKFPTPPTPPTLPNVGAGKENHPSIMEIDPREIIIDKSKDKVPYISYPLAKDPNAEFSEYIFEDVDNIYPVFKWSIEKSSAEVIILHKDRIFSVDYLPSRNKIYFIRGSRNNRDGVELPYLRKDESIPFIKINNGSISLESSLGYKGVFISDEIEDTKNFQEKSIQTPMTIGYNDILRLKKNDIQIFIRNTESPPEIKPAPLFRRDNPSRKYFVIFAILATIFLIGISQVVVNKEIEKEKQPDRLAAIIYNKKKFIKKKKIVKVSPKAIPKKIAKPVKPKIKPKPVQPKPKPAPKKIAKPAKPKPKPKPRKIAKPVKPKLKKKIIRPKKQVKKVSKPKKNIAKKNPIKANKVMKKTVKKKPNRGSTRGYKISSRLSGRLSRLAARGSRSANVQTETYNSSDIASSGTIEGSASEVKATQSNNTSVSSFESVARGRLDQVQGTEGLVDKKSVAFAGIPSRTVVLGDYDATRVSEILRQYLPQFRACYERELDSSGKVSGKIELHFNIGASGFVSKAGVAKSALPASLNGCVIGILKGIKFPEPLGGGVVAIKQPMFFEPRS